VLLGAALALATCLAAALERGAERSTLYYPQLEGQRLGLAVNQTARVHGEHLVDRLLRDGFTVQAIFAAEHGFRGDRADGETVVDGRDATTGVGIRSLYGRHKRPTAAQLADIDLLVFDMQDVGVRFYTFISTLHELMEACAATGTPLLVLDRPNPHGGSVDGPLLDPAFRSFVGMHPIPLVHGLTVGELAGMIAGEDWLETEGHCDLTVIPMRGYRHGMPVSLPVAPSPNLPNDQAVALYPSLGLFEATPISIGRGTDHPFQLIAYRHRDGGAFTVTPRPIPGAAPSPKLAGVTLWGQDLRAAPREGFTLRYLLEWRDRMQAWEEPLIDRPDYFDKLAGSDRLRRQLEAGLDEASIRASWQADLDAYRAMRRRYLRYPE
jgi:uncharacterized protein YbbC (DUF1343 family)